MIMPQTSPQKRGAPTAAHLQTASTITSLSQNGIASILELSGNFWRVNCPKREEGRKKGHSLWVPIILVGARGVGKGSR